jgi:hypothetical protein
MERTCGDAGEQRESPWDWRLAYAPSAFVEIVLVRVKHVAARRISLGSSQRQECFGVEEGKAASPALVHLLPVQQSAPAEPMRSGPLVTGRQL